MPQYCDSEKLEQNWFYWLLSSQVPTLEKYRELGLLWTKVIGVSTDNNGVPIRRNGKVLQDPSYPIRAHCIALATPIYFNSYDGVPQPTGMAHGKNKQKLPLDEDLTLLSDSPLHQLDHPPQQQSVIVPNLIAKGYLKELPTSKTWCAMIEDISKICNGIATRFKPRTIDEQHELSQDALVQVIQKLSTYKLRYTPGMAPVFNLLTTTIHRIMYSIMNNRTRHHKGINRILADAEAGVLPDSRRSLRVYTHKKFVKTR